MDQINSNASSTQMCQKHSSKNIEFVQVNDLSNSANNNIFYCTSCINKDLNFKGLNYLLISQIIEEGEKNIIQKWPPIDDQSIIDKLIQFTEQEDSQTSVVHLINQYFTQLKEEFLRKIDLCEKKMINRALELPIGKQPVLQQYQEISQISKLRYLLIQAQNNNVNDCEESCRQFLSSIDNQKQNNTQKLLDLLKQCNKKDQLVDFEYPNQIKNSIFACIDSIDFFNTKIDNSGDSRNEQQGNTHSNSSKIMKLISNKSNFCSERFLSQISAQLQKLNPLLQNISFDNISEQGKTQIDFIRLSEMRFNLMKEFVEHSIQLEQSAEYLAHIKNSQEYKHLELILENKLNLMNSSLKEQLKLFLVDTYPLLKQVNFSEANQNQENLKRFNLLSETEVQVFIELIKKRQELVQDNGSNQSRTDTIKPYIQNCLNKFEDAEVVLRQFPIFDLMQKKILNEIDIKLQKTNFNGGRSNIDIIQDRQVSINEEINDLFGPSPINCVSDIILENEKKYIFRFKIDKFRFDTFGLNFGLMENNKCDSQFGYSNYLSCYLQNENNIISHEGNFGIDKQLKGGRLRLSDNNEIEMRVWLQGKKLEVLDYPNYEFKLGLQDQYQKKLIKYKDLKLYIGFYNKDIKVTLTSAVLVEEFSN